MTGLSIAGIGVAAPGLPGWSAAVSILAGRAPNEMRPVASLPTHLPGTERRRANETSRWSIAAALDAVTDATPERVAAFPTVFASADGDGAVLDAMLVSLAERNVAVSPTLFHNSVFNAPAGYWGIGAHAQAPSTTICAGDATFAAGLLESYGFAAAMNSPVLLVACDLPFPSRVPLTCGGHAPFACALLLEPAGTDTARWGRIDELRMTRSHPRATARDAKMDAEFQGNASAAALLLLRAIAGRRAGPVALPYLDGASLELQWRP